MWQTTAARPCRNTPYLLCQNNTLSSVSKQGHNRYLCSCVAMEAWLALVTYVVCMAAAPYRVPLARDGVR
jgi:hypothetical protein